VSATLEDLDGLPDEIKQLIQPHLEPDEATLNTIGIEIAAKRDEAVAARKSSGIEDVWRDADEAYLGIDDANRHEWVDAKWAKPMTMSGPLTSNRADDNADKQSTIFLLLTARYVDAGAAKLGEILLPADDKAFSFSEMPVPELIDAKEDEREVIHSQMGVPLTRKPGPDDPASPDSTQPGQGPGAAPTPVPVKVKDFANEAIEIARNDAKAAETRIYDWLVASKYTAEARKVIFDAARIGVGVIKGPVPKSRKFTALTRGDNKVKVFFKEEIKPAVTWVDPWNFYPDAACGEDIQDGSHCFECDFFSARKVEGLKKEPGYIKAQIDAVLEEGPGKVRENGSEWERGRDKTKDQYQVWFFYGVLTKDEMQAIDAAANKKPPAAGYTENIYAIVTLINDRVVKAVLNPLDSGKFPYSIMPWQRRSGSWAGRGVAEQMRAAQRVVNGAARALLNNAGMSAGPQIIIDQRGLRPADGSRDWTLYPWRIWLTTEDAPEGDVRQLISSVEFPSTTEELERIIQLGERMAEETTSIPLISQGQSGATTPDTFGAAQLQNNNANQLLRSIGYSYDDCVTEPLIHRYYEWLLLDQDVPNEEKGEWQINAHGSVALVERAIQDQTIGQMGQLVANPIYEFDPALWAEQWAKSKHLNPKDFKYTPEKLAKMQAAPPPEAPQVTAAKINADTALKVAELGATADQQSVASSERIKQAANVLEQGRIQSDQHATVVDATVRLHEIQAEAENTINQLKAQLAETTMKLQVEQRLNAANQAVDVHKHTVDKRVDLHKHFNPQPKPEVQVPGRARNGQQASQAGA
jgi:hypothetical protein